MKIKDARDFYYFFSAKTSDLVRQLSFAGIAIIWIFKIDNDGIPKIPADCLLPLALIITGLILDFLQYVIASLIWGIYQRNKECQEIPEDLDFLAPKYFNWPGITFFTLKIIAVIIAYVLLLQYLATKVI